MTHEELGHLLSLVDSEGVDKGQSVTLTQPELLSALQDLYNQHQKMKRDWATTAHRQSEEYVRQIQLLKNQLAQSQAEGRALSEQNKALAIHLETYENRELAAQAEAVKTLSASVESITRRIPHEDAVHLAEAFRYLAHWSERVIAREKVEEAAREQARADEAER